MVRELPAGYKVRFAHVRYTPGGSVGTIRQLCGAEGRHSDMPSLLPKGGRTVAEVIAPDGVLAARGEAYCHPKDSFNKRIGRDIALGRALKHMEVSHG